MNDLEGKPGCAKIAAAQKIEVSGHKVRKQGIANVLAKAEIGKRIRILWKSSGNND